MSLQPLRTLFFEDLSVGMTERLEKTVASSDVVGFAQLTGDRLKSSFDGVVIVARDYVSILGVGDGINQCL